MFLWRNKENYPLIITKYPPDLFYWSENKQLSDCNHNSDLSSLTREIFKRPESFLNHIASF